MKQYRIILIAISILIVCFGIYAIAVNARYRCSLEGHKTVICIPVYGQSLALGEEAIRITDFDSLRINYNGRIVNEHLNYQFGGYAEQRWRRTIKRLFGIHKRSFELSIYRMAEELATKEYVDSIIGDIESVLEALL